MFVVRQGDVFMQFNLITAVYFILVFFFLTNHACSFALINIWTWAWCWLCLDQVEQKTIIASNIANLFYQNFFPPLIFSSNKVSFHFLDLSNESQCYKQNFTIVLITFSSIPLKICLNNKYCFDFSRDFNTLFYSTLPNIYWSTLDQFLWFSYSFSPKIWINQPQC